jgi:hypothetical protein
MVLKNCIANFAILSKFCYFIVIFSMGELKKLLSCQQIFDEKKNCLAKNVIRFLGFSQIPF